MGEARRRKALETHFKAVAREGQGVHSLDIWRHAEVLGLMDRAVAGERGSPQAKLVASLAHQFLAKRGTPQSALCFCCGGPVPQFAALVSIAPHIDQPTKVIGGAVCLSCDGTDQELRDRVLAVWRAVDPSARPIDIHPTEGRA
jgi:hypothetical protein